MRFRNVHKAVSYLVAALGMTVLALGHVLHPAVIASAAVAGGVSWWAEEPLISRPWYVRAWTAGLLVLLVVQTLRVALSGALIECGVELAVVLQVSRLFNRRGAQEYQQIVVLAIVHLIASSVLDQGLSFAALLVGFVVVLPWVMTLSHLRREIEGNYRRTEPEAQRAHVHRILNSRRIVGARFLWVVALLALPVFAMSGTLFLLFPRVGLGILASGPRRRITVAGFSDQVRLGDLGVVRNDDTVVMRVEVDPMPDPIPQRLDVHWRGTAYDRYDGRGWSRSPELERRAPMTRRGERYCITRECGVRSDRLVYRIYLEDLDPPVLLIPPGAAAVRMSSQRRGRWLVYRRLLISPSMEVRREAEPTLVVHYEVELRPDAPAAIAVREDDVTPYLQLPPLDPRIGEMAREATSATRGDALRSAAAVAEHLRAGYRYSLDLRGTSDERPLEDFLLRRRSGHCEFFSTAMAVMLRTVGVPTRNVTGFLGGRLNRYGSDGAYYVVTQSDAHSWVEVYDPAAGWVTFDPTPPAQGPQVAPSPWAFLRELLDATELAWEKNVVAYDLDAQIGLFGSTYLRARALRHELRRTDVPRAVRESLSTPWVLAAVFAALALGIVAYALRRRRALGMAARRPRAAPSLAKAAALLRSLDRALARRGLSRPPWRTPAEHVEVLRDQRAPAVDLVQDVVTRYNDVRFGGREFRDGELAELQAAVREISSRSV
jgi:hypothetical protein